MDPGSRDVLIHRYVENGQVTRTFWEWRYKLLSLTFVVLPALGALATWAYQQHLGPIVAIPLVLSTVFCGAFSILNQRTQAILKECYDVAAEIENRWDADDPASAVPGTYKAIRRTGERGLTYARTLKYLYALLAVVSFLGAVLLLVL